MSPDPVQLAARPVAVRVVQQDVDQWLAGKRRAELEAARAQGAAEGEARALAGAAALLAQAAEALEAQRLRDADALAKDSVELAVAIARRLVRAEIDAGRHGIEALVRETLAASGAGRGACTVHLHPADLARLEGVPFRAGTELQADHEVARGDVHVTTARGTIVREVDAALAAAAARLLEDLPS